jgi:hypothetical protein
VTASAAAAAAGSGLLPAGLAALMLAVAAYSAGRLIFSRLWRRPTELDADGLHVVMGVAMAGMLEPRLGPLPRGAWAAVFAAAAAWFAWRAVRARQRGASGGALSQHPVPHLVECAAMVYMLVPVFTRPAGAPAMAMPGMSGSAAGFPVLALILALFMIGYIVWTTDRITSLSRATAASTILAPRLAGCSKIAMSAAMGFMLLQMI